jgi:polysaccharide deacetylase family sporulation protein PdaB
MEIYQISRKKIILSIALMLTFIYFLAMLYGPWNMTAQSVVSQTTGIKKLRPIYSVETEEPKIAISFDASWGSERTESLLKILDQYHVKTTFFLVNLWLDKYPLLAKSIMAKGHEIGMHSTTHPDFAKLSKQQMQNEIVQNYEKIVEVTGHRPILFRPPFGSYNNTLLELTDSLGMYCIQWDVDSLDWRDISDSEIYNRVTSKVKNGSIVLFHNDGKNTPQALGRIIENLQGRGYKIVPISELIYKKDFTIDHMGIQRKIDLSKVYLQE